MTAPIAKPRKRGLWWKIPLAGILGLFLLEMLIVALSSNNPPPPPSLSPEQIKAQSMSVSYQSLARKPDQYIGKIVTFVGQVDQVLEDGNDLTLRISVTPKRDFDTTLWDDTIYVEYRKPEPAGRILEHDVVVFWGRFEGIKSYQAIFNNTVQIPWVTAYIIQEK